MSDSSGSRATDLLHLVRDLANALGATPEEGRGAWEQDLDDGWWLAYNPHPHEAPFSRSGLPLEAGHAIFYDRVGPMGAANAHGFVGVDALRPRLEQALVEAARRARAAPEHRAAAVAEA